MEVAVFTFVAGLVALLYATWLSYSIIKSPKGTPKMIEIADAIKDGANAFLKRQYITLLPVAAILFGLIYYYVGANTAIAFVVGLVSSALAGYIGMQISVRGNVRVAEAAKLGLSEALSMAFKGGSVTGMALAGLGLVGLSSLYYVFNGDLAPFVGFGFGASLLSLFARVGGGIYTKAADVGADLVGKIEKGIPEDDPRNPAVIADNVGDNVGDCAGMAADVFESFVVTIIAAMLLGAVLGQAYVVLPMIIASFGVLSSVIGSLSVKLGRNKKIMQAFYKGIAITALFMLLFTYLFFAKNPIEGISSLNLFFIVLIGVIVTAAMFGITEYYTAKEYGPVKNIANSAKTGAGTNLINGLATGMKSTAAPVLLIAFAIACSYFLGGSGIVGLYGVALAAAAMLSLSGIIIAIDSYGPITDNAGGIAEMAGLPKKIRSVTDPLDAVGNTTKATTKGFAIAGAALGALALFVAYSWEAKIETINLLDPTVTIGLFIGALLPFLFSSMLMTAVGKAAFQIVEEVRRQFKEIKGLMDGKAKADYARCVDISTATALKELISPGIVAIASPLIVGLVFGPAALGGLLAGAIASGLLLALTMCTAGAAWDNAKKYIEDGKLGGKGSDAHKAAVIGDTVGDPLKDTAGPALNALIKVVNTVSLVFAGIIIEYGLKVLGA